jgi:small ligand-binding sensory domain FIST
MNHIEQLQARVAQAAQEAALLEAQARAVNELAAEARARLVCLRSDLEAALRAQSLAVLRAGWQEQDAQGGINARPAP